MPSRPTIACGVVLGSVLLWSFGCSGGQGPQEGPPFDGKVTHGLAIPSARPRLWFDGPRLAAARAWYAANPFAPSAVAQEYLALERATRGLLNAGNVSDQQAQCRAALDWAIPMTASLDTGRDRDGTRYHGEAIIATYDWCHGWLTAAEKAAYIQHTNAWIQYFQFESYGGPPTVGNNYFWSRVRNQLLWAITSYEDNVSAAEAFLDDTFSRWIGPGTGTFMTLAESDVRGGALLEGTQYGVYPIGYSVMPFRTTATLGRDVKDTETDFFKEAVYGVIYQTPRGVTTTTLDATNTYRFFPDNDVQGNGAGDGGWSRALRENFTANVMTDAAVAWGDRPLGRHARAWLNMVGAAPYTAKYIQATDPGGSALPLSGLPLDYYASGPRWMYGRSSSADAASTFVWKLGDLCVASPKPYVGHAHADFGTWQLWRGGRFLARETPGYAGTSAYYVAGYGGAGTADTVLPVAHNSLLVNGSGAATALQTACTATVPRLESRPEYTYAVVNLTPVIRDTANWNSWVREFLFVRGLETLVVLDRVGSDAAGATKTFLSHCETDPVIDSVTDTAVCTVGNQAYSMWTLTPSGESVTYRKVVEGGTFGQHRIEVDTRPGTANSHILTVLQARAAASPALSPSVVDNGSSYTVTLDPLHVVTFEKGATSVGGSITVGGSTRSLRADAQGIVVTDDGPAWQP